MRWHLVLLAAALAVPPGQAEEKAADRQPKATARAGSIGLGADFLGPSFRAEGKSYMVPRHLVVEIGLEVPEGEELAVSHADFQLRVNGEKIPRLPQNPGLAAAGLKYPDWHRQKQVIVAAGPVIIGPPVPQPRFPGDRRPIEGRAPLPPQAPADPSGGNAPEQEQEFSPAELLVQSALAEGPAKGKLTGNLFFPYDKPLKSIRSLEVVYQGPAGEAILRLR